MTNIKIKMELNKHLTFIQGERAFMHFSECFFTYNIKSIGIANIGIALLLKDFDEEFNNVLAN